MNWIQNMNRCTGPFPYGDQAEEKDKVERMRAEAETARGNQMTDEETKQIESETARVTLAELAALRAMLAEMQEGRAALEKRVRAEERQRCDKIIEEMQGDMPAMLVDMRLVALMFNALRHRVAEND